MFPGGQTWRGPAYNDNIYGAVHIVRQACRSWKLTAQLLSGADNSRCCSGERAGSEAAAPGPPYTSQAGPRSISRAGGLRTALQPCARKVIGQRVYNTFVRRGLKQHLFAWPSVYNNAVHILILALGPFLREKSARHK